MPLKAKRIISVYFFALTAFSLGLALLSIHHFSMIGWLLLSLQVELGIFIFCLMLIGIVVGCCWAMKGDDDQSFMDYFKSLVKDIME